MFSRKARVSRRKETFSEGVALGYNGSGRRPEDIPVIEYQSSSDFTKEW
jgi:hypothetical protein